MHTIDLTAVFAPYTRYCDHYVCLQYGIQSHCTTQYFPVYSSVYFQYLNRLL